MAKNKKRRELEMNLGYQIGRELSARTILFHQALANIAGITVTDLKCLDYIERTGDVSAGDLARLTGLTTGSITAALDRMEKAGLIRRERSDEDRRKVYLRILPSPILQKLMPMYEGLGKGIGGLLEDYSTHDLEIIQDFLTRCIEILRKQTEIAQKMA